MKIRCYTEIKTSTKFKLILDIDTKSANIFQLSNNYIMKLIPLDSTKQMIFHLLLYASFSLRQAQFLNLTQCLLTYWIAFITVCLYSYLLIIDILRSLNLIQCLYTFFIKTSKISTTFSILQNKAFSLKMFLLCLIFRETLLPVNSKNNS